MKKLISLVLILVLTLSLITSCELPEVNSGGSDSGAGEGENQNGSNENGGSGDTDPENKPENDSEGSEGEHTHTPSDPVNEGFTPSTCQSAGGYTSVVYCSTCKEVLESTTVVLPITDHNYENDVCTVCGDSIALPASEGLEFTISADRMGYLVSGIGSCTDVDIVVPDTYKNLPVVGVYEYAFRENTTIKSIYLPDGATVIETCAFWDCTSLESIILPNSITKIESGAFANCTSLKSFKIPEKITWIEDGTFLGCTSLTTLHIPAAVSTIISMSFSNCSSLSTITVDPENKNYTALDGVLYLKDMSALLCYPCGKTDESFKLPYGVKEVISSAFRGNQFIKKIDLSDSVETFSPSAFFNCNSLESVSIPMYVTKIEGNFSGCNPLTELNFENITCWYQDGVNLPHATYDEFVDFLRSSNCYEIYCHVNTAYRVENKIDSTCVSRGSYDNLCYCVDCERVMSLETVVIDYSDHNYEGGVCIYCGDKTVTASQGLNLVLSGNGSYYSVKGIGVCSDTEVIIPAEVDGIPVKYIESDAFNRCTNITSVVIPDSVIEIGNYAFSICESLTSVTIGKRVEYIGYGCFEHCYALREITIPESVIYLGDYMFSDTESLAKINVDPANANYTSLDGVLYTKDMRTLMCYPSAKADESFTLPTGVITIANSAFKNNTYLKTCVVSEGVELIDYGAFMGCSNLVNLDLPSTVTKIEYRALAAGYSLTNLTIHKDNASYKVVNNVVYTKDGGVLVFYLLSNTDKSFVIPEGVKTIETQAFYANSNIEELTIPESMEWFDISAILMCQRLKTLKFLDTEGWYFSTTYGATSGTNISPSILEDTQNTLTNIKRYYNYGYFYNN